MFFERFNKPKPKTEVVETEGADFAKPQKKRERKTDKGDYESIATNNYFEGFDEDVELEGNPEIKEQIRQNILKSEKINQVRYESAAHDLGISVEEFKVRLQAKIEDMVEKAQFFRATNINVLERVIITDGRWKSQFETATSNGTLDPAFRAAKEIQMFGFNQAEASLVDLDLVSGWDRVQGVSMEVLEKDKERRPIYGYFSDEEHGAINHEGKIPPPTSVETYGTVNFKIKKDRALKKATVTFHDSLGPGSDWPPTPAIKPHFTSFKISYAGHRFLEELRGPSVVNWGGSYTEVQYHGQLTMDDVEDIYVSAQNSYSSEEGKETVKRAREIFDEYKRQHPESTIKLIEF